MIVKQTSRARVRTRVILVVLVTSAVLAGCGAHTATSSSGSTIETPTAYLSPTSLCSSEASFLTQNLNGDLSGCFRVPSIRTATLVVSLQAYLLNTVSKVGATTTTTTTTPSTPGGALRLRVTSGVVRPGERVVIRGRYATHAATPRNSSINVCWDGCQRGLVEQGVTVHWTSATTFRTTLRVPQTAWLESGGNGVTIHPLTSGRYSVAVQCLGEISGCALRPGDASVEVHLDAPTPRRCASSQTCTKLLLSEVRAGVGDVIEVRGWAPLESLIGPPFGFNLSVARAAKGAHYPSLSFARTSSGGGLSVDLAPQILHVAASRTWSSLGHLASVAAHFAGPSPIDVVSGTNRIAWCLPTSLIVTAGSTTITVPTAGVVAALKGTNLSLFGAATPATHPACSTVLMVPRFPSSVFAGFDTATSEGAPPIFLADLYSTDDGAHWLRVPVPKGYSDEDFAGFASNDNEVEALFASPNGGGNGVPLGTLHGEVATEITDDGGQTWSPSTLGCPANGPCATFGPYQWGNCAMNGSSQALLIGSNAARGGPGFTWRDTSWPSTVNGCFAQQLVATSSRDLLLLDPSSQYPLLRSTDGGIAWSSFALPSNDGETFTDGAPLGATLVMAPDGSLFAAQTSTSGMRQTLLRLYPGAARWCEVPGELGVSAAVGVVSAMRVSPTDLVWTQVRSPATGPESASTHVVAFSRLHC